MRVSIYTFGCTVNNYETQELNRLFKEKGDEVTEKGDADIIIINSCAITGTVEKGVLQLISRQRNKNPRTVIILLGCYVEYLKKNGKKEIAEYNIVIMDKKNQNVIDEVHQLYDKQFMSVGKQETENKRIKEVFQDLKPSRVLLQIQNGCNNGCSYCIVPYVRGRSVSIPYSDIKEKLYNLAWQGYKEVVLAGLNLGHYEQGSFTLIDVMEEAETIQGLETIRLSSLEPMNIGDRFIERLPKITKLSPHLHISLQSGSNRILSLMNRNYNIEDYLLMLQKIREKIPNIAITTDIIVGFPGESEKDFQESINNIIRCQFSDVHIFKYSKRKGTAAALMDKQVTEHQKISRSNLLKGVKMQTRYYYYSQFVGNTEKAVILKQVGENLWEGVTTHNFKVIAESKVVPSGIVNIEITGMNTNQEAFKGKIL